MKKQNDVILRSVTRIAVIIILTFAINLFFSGHHAPGGGFVGGLALACAITLLFLTFDIESVRENMPVDFKAMAATGVLIAILTGVGGMIYDDAFLTQAFNYYNLPLFGKTELATAMAFDLGVALAVIGTAMTIIITISEDR
ncbi:Na(+)/H(+) antiporter subunit B [Neobacillus notoginsengisoli]|uniref:Na(+)/H(+) antiporter subunit B n=1 Tax=Neobacillus notoginsengisoli TaxID=1578198 RepID=A0A417YRG6_9BACI|nr:Na(+)/H(+) antiporter subunit B [Neobacillus notoginsengisoli]RHW38001.1 Na(+)/H(+) antiporter subunit B [Neobacillus notoginsengisoli]